jgi:ribosomal protein L34E
LFANKTKDFELGRWKIDYNINVIKHRVEMANEDNCGSCGHYLQSVVKNDIKPSDLFTNKESK